MIDAQYIVDYKALLKRALGRTPTSVTIVVGEDVEVCETLKKRTDVFISCVRGTVKWRSSQ